MQDEHEVTKQYVDTYSKQITALNLKNQSLKSDLDVATEEKKALERDCNILKKKVEDFKVQSSREVQERVNRAEYIDLKIEDLVQSVKKVDNLVENLKS